MPAHMHDVPCTTYHQARGSRIQSLKATSVKNALVARSFLNDRNRRARYGRRPVRHLGHFFRLMLGFNFDRREPEVGYWSLLS